MNEREGGGGGGGGGERERNCIVMDGYMLMNFKKNLLKKNTKNTNKKIHGNENGRLDFKKKNT